MECSFCDNATQQYFREGDLMQERAKLRRYFPGANSAYGFYSFFEQIIGSEARRVFIIKGGPGVGKSTFMSKLGKEMQDLGYDVEYHHCASDSESLDGLVIPAMGTAFLDGTFPHIVDPQYPGAVDEIIYLGEHWSLNGIMESKEAIVKLSAEIKRTFKNVYRYLAPARLYLEGLESIYSADGALDRGGRLNRLCLELLEEIFAEKPPLNKAGKVRSIFASAITPQGTVNFLDTLVDGYSNIYILQGDCPAGMSKVIERILDAARLRGYYIEAYHCGLDPLKVEHLAIPELEVAVIMSREPHYYNNPRARCVIDTGELAIPLSLSLQAEKEEYYRNYRSALKSAVAFLIKAKSLHDELEHYYIPHMNFEEIDRLRCETRERLLNYYR
jgi:hypothetical protein